MAIALKAISLYATSSDIKISDVIDIRLLFSFGVCTKLNCQGKLTYSCAEICGDELKDFSFPVRPPTTHPLHHGRYPEMTSLRGVAVDLARKFAYSAIHSHMMPQSF